MCYCRTETVILDYWLNPSLSDCAELASFNLEPEAKTFKLFTSLSYSLSVMSQPEKAGSGKYFSACNSREQCGYWQQLGNTFFFFFFLSFQDALHLVTERVQYTGGSWPICEWGQKNLGKLFMFCFLMSTVIRCTCYRPHWSVWKGPETDTSLSCVGIAAGVLSSYCPQGPVDIFLKLVEFWEYQCYSGWSPGPETAHHSKEVAVQQHGENCTMRERTNGTINKKAIKIIITKISIMQLMMTTLRILNRLQILGLLILFLLP